MANKIKQPNPFLLPAAELRKELIQSCRGDEIGIHLLDMRRHIYQVAGEIAARNTTDVYFIDFCEMLIAFSNAKLIEQEFFEVRTAILSQSRTCQ